MLLTSTLFSRGLRNGWRHFVRFSRLPFAVSLPSQPDLASYGDKSCTTKTVLGQSQQLIFMSSSSMKLRSAEL